MRKELDTQEVPCKGKEEKKGEKSQIGQILLPWGSPQLAAPHKADFLASCASLTHLQNVGQPHQLLK